MSATKGLIFLDSRSAILHEQLRPRILENKREPCEITFCDFDGVGFKICVEIETLNIVTVAAVIKSIDVYKSFGAQEIINELYPGCESAPPKDYNFALTFDCDNLPTDPEKFLTDVSEMKRHIMGGPYSRYFKALLDKSSASLPHFMVEYRNKEAAFIVAGDSKITVIFLVDFADITDRALAKVFLQEFAEAQRIVRNAPPVTYSKDVHPDLRNVPHKHNPECAGYLSFSVEERHIKGDVNFTKAVTLMATFRNYLHYHIKASKTYLHMRMRKRVAGWMQILNRAIPEAESEKKTITGKTFTKN